MEKKDTVMRVLGKVEGETWSRAWWSASRKPTLLLGLVEVLVMFIMHWMGLTLHQGSSAGCLPSLSCRCVP